MQFNIALHADNRFSNVYDFCDNIKDANAAYNSFHNVYKELFDKHFSLKTTSEKKKCSPIAEWMTKGLVKACNKKSLLYKKYKTSGLAIDKQKFVTYRNKLKSILNEEKRNFYSHKFKSAAGNLKETWNIINKFTKNDPISKCSQVFNDNGKVLESDVDIANKFNYYFANIGKTLAANISPCNSNFKIFKR